MSVSTYFFMLIATWFQSFPFIEVSFFGGIINHRMQWYKLVCADVLTVYHCPVDQQKKFVPI